VALSELWVSLWRGGAGGGQFKTYTVPQRESQTVPDIVTFVQRHIDPTLSYRFAGRVGVCGSCAPFLVESDLAGNSLFERENAKIAPGLEQLYAGTRPATLHRYGETDDKTKEVI
jgi:succinate dehydrogenase/fumarate reductase-like Fe-S protein